MSAQDYYHGHGQPYQGNQQHNYQNNYQQAQSDPYGSSAPIDPVPSQDRANPYGYPESSTPQPYYGHNNQTQQPSYGQQQYQAYDYQSQPYNQYDTQSYNYQQTAPPTYDNSYSQAPQPGVYNPQQPSHEMYASTYGSGRSQDYDQYNAYSNTPSQPFSQTTATGAGQPLPQDPNAPMLAQGESDRGLMGALAGGAVGAYGGHKMGHGIIGGIGGAIAGSKLEDHYKDKKKEEKRQHGKHHSQHGAGRRRRGSRSSSSSSSSSSDSDSDKNKLRKHRSDKHTAAAAGVAGAGAYAASHAIGHGGGSRGYAGNFSTTASNITLDRDYDLIALCKDHHGNDKLSAIHLNDYLTNEWGSFRWVRGGNAFASAKNVRLVDHGRVLEADLADGRGGWSGSRIVLDERIGNEGGELVFRD